MCLNKAPPPQHLTTMALLTLNVLKTVNKRNTAAHKYWTLCQGL